jgi:hypothetical protein
VKWINDQLDEIPGLSGEFPDAPLANQADCALRSTIAVYRTISPKSVVHTIDLANAPANASSTDRVHLVDQWGQPEIEALKHTVRTLEIFGIGTTAPVIAENGSASLTLGDKSVDVVAVRGSSHESCLAHCRNKFVPNPRRQVILASRDSENTRWARKFGSFLSPPTTQLGDETSITDPNQNILHIGFQNLLEVFRTAEDTTALQGGIHAGFAA